MNIPGLQPLRRFQILIKKEYRFTMKSPLYLNQEKH